MHVTRMSGVVFVSYDLLIEVVTLSVTDSMQQVTPSMESYLEPPVGMPCVTIMLELESGCLLHFRNL